MIASGSSPGRSAAMTSSTTGSSFSTRWTRVQPRTASAGVAAARAPKRSKAFAFDAVRFQTTTCSPRPVAASTNPLPRRPVPRKATGGVSVILHRGGLALPVRFHEPEPLVDVAGNVGAQVGRVLVAQVVGLVDGGADHAAELRQRTREPGHVIGTRHRFEGVLT